MLADARGFYQSLLGCLIDKRFRGASQSAHFGELNSPRAVPNTLWRIMSIHRSFIIIFQLFTRYYSR
jgi:hypothetical protein